MKLSRRTLLKSSVALGVSVAFPRIASAAQTLHMSHIFSLEDPKNVASERFAKEVQEATDGEIVIKVHPLSQMAGLRDGVEGTRMGTIDITMADTATLGSWAPELGLWSLPFVFRDYDQILRVMAGPVEDWRVDVINNKLGLVSLGHAVTAFRVIINSKRPITHADDIVGIKMRVPEIPVYVSTFQMLEANPTPIPWGEVYSALQTRTVDGVESDPIGLELANFLEVTKFASPTNHILLDTGLLFNKNRFTGLSPANQEKIRDLGNKIISEELSKHSIDVQNKSWQKFADKLTISEVDRESFIKKLHPLLGEFAKKYGTEDIIKQIDAS